MAGVEIGRVVKIDFDTREYKAVVTMRVNEKYNQIPTDSDASIYTQGLLGGKFIGLTAGGAETYLKSGDHIDFTQSAFVLENLIGQVSRISRRADPVRRHPSRGAGRHGAPRGEDQMTTIRSNQSTGRPASSRLARLRRASPSARPDLPPRAMPQRRRRRMRGPWTRNSWWTTPPSACWRNWTPSPDVCKDPRSSIRWWRTCCCQLRQRLCGAPGARPILAAATPDQRKRFVDAFYHSLLRNYGAALLNFTADRFVILPYKGEPGDTQATVRTEVKKDTGEKSR